MSDLRFHISIPTLNSSATLGLAIDSVKAQTYYTFSLNVVDSYSTDDTATIAKAKDVAVVLYRGKLLGARYEGFIHEDCDYVVFMDSDQVLAPDFLSKLDAQLQASPTDMVIVEEHSYHRDTLVQRMYDLDRTIVQTEYGYNVSPEHGVLLPRVFSKQLLTAAFAKIDPKLYPEVVAHDHAIIYHEANKISPSVSFLSGRVIFHQEPRSLRETFWHFVGYGRNTKKFKSMGLYVDLIDSKMHGRNVGYAHKLIGKKLLTAPLLFAKAAGYYYGYYFG